MSAVAAWARLETALGPHAAHLRLRAGASEAELTTLEQTIGWPLPADYRAWLAQHDGQEPDGLQVLPRAGFLLGVADLIERWRYERKFSPGADQGGSRGRADVDVERSEASAGQLAALSVDEGSGDARYQDDQRVRAVVFHPRRLTIGGGRWLDGDNLLIDHHPGPAGVVDQVVTFTSECELSVVGRSFTDLLERTATLVERGIITMLAWEDNLELSLPSEKYPSAWDEALRQLARA